MKNRFFYLVVFLGLLIIQGCSNTKNENDWVKSDLKGKVLSYMEVSYKAVERFGNIEKGERAQEYHINYDTQIIFNKNGKIIETNMYNSDDILCIKVINKYDKKGNLIEENWYNSDGIIDGKYVIGYDTKGTQTEKTLYNSENKIEFKYAYKFDKNGNMIEEDWYDAVGKLEYKDTYKYDKMKNIIEYIKYNSDGSIWYLYTYKYNKNGKIIELNNKDYLLKSINSKIIYKYDKKNNLIEETEYLESGSTLKKKTILFDDYGNWLKKILYRNNIPTFILERKYEYY